MRRRRSQVYARTRVERAQPEFLDTEWSEPWPDPPVGQDRHPWRQHRLAANAILVPREFVEFMARSDRMVELERDPARVHMVRAEIADRGLERPLELRFDGNGHVMLYDGHHRLISTRGMPEYDRLPVVFAVSGGIQAPSVSITEVLPTLVGLIGATQ